MDSKLTVTDASFETAFKKYEKAEMIEFFASWCQHCKQMAGLVNTLAKAYANRAAVLAVDVETSPRTARRFGVQGVPAFVFVKNGQIVKRMAGEFSEEELRRQLDALLK
ncbi:thioredoxin family protein [Candidatus Avelusimicrobium gallicola]|uniref:Thioredoxin n=1 Tax=Candidatus Avelusimicrobium gallicola TaxID=2562704 RepID=A0A1Y4DDW0_9BACT|nr:thioredoxin domain-containing protein [Elusimicrobium sp. An273]OUO57226.1 hypothetical protein B5F75_00135 [Elusimicrobium sp. An273]